MRGRRQQILAARPNRPAVRRGPAAGRLAPRRGGGAGRGRPRPGQGGGAGRGRGGGGEPAPMPWDSSAQRESSELGNEAADTRATLTSRWQEQQEEMGLGDGASNPYSHAAQLARERDTNQRGVVNTAGSNLYSGSTVNAQRQTESQYDEGFNKLTASYDRSKQAYERGVGRTDRDFEQGMAAIKEGAINRALASEPQPLAPGGGARRSGRAARPGRSARQPARRPSRGRAAMGAIAYGGRRRRR